MSSITTEDRIIRNRALFDETLNPCAKEQKRSLQCQSMWSEEECYFYIQNHRECKRFWRSVMNEREAKGIEPVLPPPEERKQIRKEYTSLKT